MSGTTTVRPGDGTNAVGQVEARGLDTIPAEEQQARPQSLFWLMMGGNMTFGVVLFGWLPVAFGLGWWSALSATTVGLLIGVSILGPMARFGPRTGTNGAVSSSAHFGVRGRTIGTCLALFIGTGFVALTVWTGGEALVGGLHVLVGLPSTDLAHGLAYTLITCVIVLVGTYGHATVMALERTIAIPILVLLLVGFAALAGRFDPGYAGGAYLLESFWPTWLLSVTVAASLPISYTPFINDYSRYVAAGRTTDRAVIGWTALGAFAAMWIGMVFAAFAATTFADPTVPFVRGLLDGSPAWYAVPIVLIGLGGSLTQGSLATYSTGLNLTSLFTALRRLAATGIIAVVVIALVFLGTFLWNAVDTVNAFISVFVIFTTPWAVINLIGYARHRGQYARDDLQAYATGRRDGRYWFTRGWNLPAVVAWSVGAGVGALLANTTLWIGPWADLAGGVDLSFVGAGLVGGVLYAGLLALTTPRVTAPSTPARASRRTP